MYYLALYKDTTKFKNKLISYWLKSKYTHCEIYDDYDDWLYGVSFDKGVRFIKHPLNRDKWDLIPIPYLKFDRVYKFACDTENNQYDWKGLFFGLIFNHNKQNKDKWTCSEWVAELLEISLTNKIKLTPEDIKELVEWKGY